MKLRQFSGSTLRILLVIVTVFIAYGTTEYTGRPKQAGEPCDLNDKNWYPTENSIHHFLSCVQGKLVRERCAEVTPFDSDDAVVKIFDKTTQQCYMPPAKIQRQAYVAGSARVGDICVQNTDCLRGAYCSSGTCNCLSDFVGKDYYCYPKINPSQSGCSYNEQCTSVWPGATCDSTVSNGLCTCPTNFAAAETRDGFVCVDVSQVGISTCPTPIGSGAQTAVKDAAGTTNIVCTVGAVGVGACNFNGVDISDVYDCLRDQPGTAGICCPSRALACIQPQSSTPGGGSGETRFYYNSVSGTCEQFYWDPLSTNNNANNFQTRDHCESYCKTTCPRGPPQYANSGSLQRNRPINCQGTYSTCDSNHECIAIGSTSNCCPDTEYVCGPYGGKAYPGIPTGFDAGFTVANQARQRWYYDPTRRACQIFSYQGGGGNFNNFGTQQDCDNYCQRLLCDRGTPIRDNSGVGYQGCSSSTGCPSSHLCTNNVCCPTAQTVCAEPIQQGTCTAYVTRYWYNAITRDCDPFTYSGCQGNDNNFESLLSCQNYCRNTNAEPRCIQGQAFKDGAGAFLQCSSTNTGFGTTSCPLNYECYFDGFRYGCCPTKSYTCSLSAAIGVTCGPQSTRWYYDTTTQTCQTVAYNGCDGNSNNFPTRDLCESYCSVGGCPSGGQPYRDGTNAIQVCSNGIPCPSGYECNRVAVGTSSINRCCPTKASICLLPPNSALSGISVNSACSNTQIARYYFNRATSSCTTFTFNGCSSNGNNFATLAQCQNFCNSAACEAGETVYVDPNSQRPLTCNSFLSNSNSNQCPTGYTCRNDRLNGNQNVCCGSTDMGVCPSGEKAFVDALLIAARECLPNIAASCPNNFLCRFNTNLNKYYCCASSSGSICPTGKSPYYTSGSTTPTVCTLGNVFNSCPTSYSCQSAVAGGFQGYCCSINSICLNGANYYVDTQTNLPRTCVIQNFNSFNGCPTGYSCQSNNINGLQPSSSGYCCQGSSTAASVCGTAQPYLVNNQPQQCFPNSFTQQCPQGYACTATQNNIYYCCSQAQSTGSCPAGLQPEILNGQVRSCSLQFSQCGVGYSCQYISGSNSYQCCGQSTQNTFDGCPPGYIGYSQPGTNQVQTCQIQAQFGNQCPNGYSCQYSTTRNRFQCCGFQGGCPQGTVAAMNPQNGQGQSCTVGQFGGCPNGYNCAQGTNGAGVCCTGGVNVPTTSLPGQPCGAGQTCVGGSTCINSFCQCQTGTLQGNTCVASAVLPIGSACAFGQQCAGGSQCLNGRCQCQPGQIIQNNQCTNQVNPNPEECPGSQSALLFPGTNNPVMCTPNQRPCPLGFQCFYSLNKLQYICCGNAQQSQACYGTCINSGSCQSGYTCRFNSLTNSNQCCPSGPVNPPQTGNCAMCCCIDLRLDLTWDDLEVELPIELSIAVKSSQVFVKADLYCNCKSCHDDRPCNGCPRGAAYLFPGTATPLSCPQGANRCPGGYFCVFSTANNAYQCCSQQRLQRHQSENGFESSEKSTIDLKQIDLTQPGTSIEDTPGTSIQETVIYPQANNSSKWNQIVFPPVNSFKNNIKPAPVIISKGRTNYSTAVTKTSYVSKKSLGKTCELDDDCFYRCSRFRDRRVCMCPRHQVLDTSITPPQCRSSCRIGYKTERGVCISELSQSISDLSPFGDRK